MSRPFKERELKQACRVLFDNDLHVSRDFLQYLQKTGLKKAFRKRAFEEHPDTRVLYNINPDNNNGEGFTKVKKAYEALNRYIGARENGFSLPGSSTGIRPRGTTLDRRQRKQPRPSAKPDQSIPNSQKIYQGPIPDFPLLFGRFLYYNGQASWQTIIKALLWQRRQRPRFGEIGCDFGWLSEETNQDILASRQAGPFGQIAVRSGFLTEAQARLILFKQQRLQRRFGQYFIEKKLLLPVQLAELVSRQKIHNAAVVGRTF
jgi:hypothetical protein